MLRRAAAFCARVAISGLLTCVNFCACDDHEPCGHWHDQQRSVLRLPLSVPPVLFAGPATGLACAVFAGMSGHCWSPVITRIVRARVSNHKVMRHRAKIVLGMRLAALGRALLSIRRGERLAQWMPSAHHFAHVTREGFAGFPGRKRHYLRARRLPRIAASSPARSFGGSCLSSACSICFFWFSRSSNLRFRVSANGGSARSM